jgi:hypothetical protein
MEHDGGSVTKYGFIWGPVEVMRACADGRYRTLLIQTEHQEVQISISPTGRSVRVYQSKRSRVSAGAEHAGSGK